MKIGIGSDHAGFRYKEKIKQLLTSLGHEVEDFGTHSEESVDYPLFIRPVAEAVAGGRCERGIVLGGSGNGEAMAANRVRGVRCALCWSLGVGAARPAAQRRQHALPGRAPDPARRWRSASSAIWLDTPFEEGRHERRIRLTRRAGRSALTNTVPRAMRPWSAPWAPGAWRATCRSRRSPPSGSAARPSSSTSRRAPTSWPAPWPGRASTRCRSSSWGWAPTS